MLLISQSARVLARDRGDESTVQNMKPGKRNQISAVRAIPFFGATCRNSPSNLLFWRCPIDSKESSSVVVEDISFLLRSEEVSCFDSLNRGLDDIRPYYLV